MNELEQVLFKYKNGARNLLDAVNRVAKSASHFNFLLLEAARELDEEKGTTYMTSSAERTLL